MPGLKELFAKFDEIQKQPEQNYKSDFNISEAWNRNTNVMRANYKRRITMTIMSRAFQELSDEELRTLFTKIKKGGREEFTADRFISRIRSGEFGGFFNEHLFGSTQDELYAAYDEALGEERIRRITEESRQIVAPDEPGYPGRQGVQTEKETIDRLKQQFTSEADQTLLTEVQGYLTNVDPTVREYLDTYTDAGAQGGSAFLDVVDYRANADIQEELSSLDGGAYGQYIHPTDYEDHYNFEATDRSQRSREMEPERQEQLAGHQNILSRETLDAAEQITGTMETLDYRNTPFVHPAKNESMKPYPDETGEALVYMSEQGQKYYAFWPLIMAKRNLTAAVRNAEKTGNLEEVRKTAAAYKTVEDKFTAMLQNVHDDKVSQEPLFSGNVNSTRSDTSEMPPQFTQDFVGHNKLNSLYLLHGYCKTMNISPREFITNPAGTTRKIADRFRDGNGMDSRKGIGASLAWNLQDFPSYPVYQRYQGEWAINHRAYGRAVAGVLGLEKDPKKRKEFAAVSHLAAVNAAVEIEKESAQMQKLYDIAAGKVPDATEKLDRIYQHAAIRPAAGENAFNIRKLTESLSKPNREDWMRETDISAELGRPERVNRLDFRELAGRTEQIIKDIEEERRKSGVYHNFFSRDQYLMSAFRTYSKILKTAEGVAFLRDKPGYVEFQKSVKSMYLLAETEETRAYLQAAAEHMDEAKPFDILKATKDDRSFGKRDSREYTRMKKSLGNVQKLLLATKYKSGDSAKNDAYLMTFGSYDKELAHAKEDAFEYIRKKLDNGNKTGFAKQSGLDRFEEGRQVYEAICAEQEKLGLRSPAEKMYDEARLEMLLNRSDPAWAEAHLKECTAKMLYAKQFIDAKIPKEKQEAAFAPDQIQGKLRAFMRTGPMKILYDNNTPRELADLAMSGKGMYRQALEICTEKTRKAFEKVLASERLDRAVKKFTEGVSLDLAANDLNLEVNMTACHIDNPEIQKKAEQYRNDPLFQETIAYMTGGKKVEQLKKMRDTPFGEIKESDVRGSGYEKAKASLLYGKKLADACLKDLLRKQDPKMKDIPDLGKQVSELLKTKKYRNYLDKNFEELQPEEINAKTQELDDPEKLQAAVEKMQQDLGMKLTKKNPAPAQDPAQVQQEGPGLNLQ